MRHPHLRFVYGHKLSVVLWCIVALLGLVYLLITRLPTYSSCNDINSLQSLTGHQNSVDEGSLIISESKCQNIHIALVCGGFNSTKSLYVLLKSVLFYRTDVIHLHLFVDDISRRIIEELFRTWVVPDLHLELYNITKYEHEISWITSLHYSHKYGLMKLVFLEVLAKNLDLNHVILLDTDMLVLGNIRVLWEEFHHQQGQAAALGMVENQSDWYLDLNKPSIARKSWPALGRGFNSGLILVDLAQLRKYDWAQTWHQVAETELTSFLSVSLADQDIFNAVIRSHSSIVYRLPCFYNVQLNDNAKVDESCMKSSNFKIIHWNSPYKLSSRNIDAINFKNWYMTFRNWDAKLLEQTTCNRKADKGDSLSDSSNQIAFCKDLRPNQQDRLRTFLYFFDFQLEVEEVDVTMVVHLSFDRLQVLDELASHWQGPMSVAIYLPESETNTLIEFVKISMNLRARRNIGYHLVFKDRGFNYPINRLRNIALNNALTPYVYLTDVDFLPSFNLYDYLKETISEMKQSNLDDPLAKLALVVPVFENLQYKFEFPQTKKDLLTQLDLGSVSMFRDQIWPQGQSATDYAKWRASTKPYKIQWETEYEPFIVTSKNVPRFDERFIGFGWNKVESIVLMAAMEYEIVVLPEAFAIHKFHSASYDIMQHRESFKYRACINRLKRLFLMELGKKYPKFASLKLGMRL